MAFENGLGMRCVIIPSGTFTMGSPADELGREDDETAHEVTLTRAYYPQTTEVTNQQYRRFRHDHDGGGQASRSLNGDDQPAVGMCFADAVAFAAWLKGKEPDRGYCLPKEAEWERACRAETSTPFWRGSWISSGMANCIQNERPYDSGRKLAHRRTTVPVGWLPVSP